MTLLLRFNPIFKIRLKQTYGGFSSSLDIININIIQQIHFIMSYKVNQKTNVTQQENILQRQIHLLSQNGPTLGLFACNHQSNSIFMIQTITHFQQQIFLKLKTNWQSNIRVFYYLLLYHIYELEDNQQSNRILLIFKRLAYSENTKIDLYPKEQIDSKFRQFYTNATLKKLLVEFLQVLSYCKTKGKIVKMLSRYPIIDFVLILFIKAILNQKQITRLESPVNLSRLVRCFYQIFKIQSIHVKDNKYFFPKSKMTVQEGSEFTTIFEDNNTELKNPNITMCDTKNFIPNFHNMNSNDQISTDENTPQFKMLIGNQKIRKYSDYSLGNEQSTQIQKIIDEEYDEQEQNIGRTRNSKKDQNFKFDTFQNFNFKDKNKREQSPYEKLNQNNFIEVVKEQKLPVNFSKDKSENSKNKDKSETSQDTNNLVKQMNLYDGLTSLEILKFMSPNIKKTIDSNKKKSLLNILGRSKQIQIQKIDDQDPKKRFEQQTDYKIETKKEISDDIKLQKNRIQDQKQKSKIQNIQCYSNYNKSTENIVKPKSSHIYFQEDRPKHQNVNHTFHYQTKSNYYRNQHVYSPKPIHNQIIYNPLQIHHTVEETKYFAKPIYKNNLVVETINGLNKFSEVPKKYGQMNSQSFGNNLTLRYTQGNIHKPKY